MTENLLNFDAAQMAAWFAEQGEKPFPWCVPLCRWKRPASARTTPAHRHRFPGVARRDRRAPVSKMPAEYYTPTERARTSRARGRAFRGIRLPSWDWREAVRTRTCGEIISE